MNLEIAAIIMPPRRYFQLNQQLSLMLQQSFPSAMCLYLFPLDEPDYQAEGIAVKSESVKAKKDSRGCKE
jgi:hypothetical protein